MLLMMATEGLKRGSVMAVTKRFNVAHSMIHRLWKHAEHTCAMGVIYYVGLLSQKKFWESAYVFARVH